MERRGAIFYTQQPSILRYCLKAKELMAPEAIAVALAMINRKNVTLKPEYQVRLHGQVGVPPKSNLNIGWYDYIDTLPIKSIYFERVREAGKTTYHCYIQTEDTLYLVWDDANARLKDMQLLLKHIENQRYSFEDFEECFSEINEGYPDVEIVPIKNILV